MRNKKIIALVCAISMIFSVFAGFTVVNAADKGITLETTQNGTNVTVTAKYVGFDTGINSGKIVISVPEGATVEPSTPLMAGKVPATGVEDIAAAPGTVGYSIMAMGNATSEGNVMAVFNITLADELSKDFKVELLDGSNISNAEGVLLTTEDEGDSKLGAASTTILADPSKTPTPVLDKPTVPDDVTQPEVKEPVGVKDGKGIDLAAVKNADGTYTVTAKYVGFDTGINSGKIVISVPEGATVEPSTPLMAGKVPATGVEDIAAAPGTVGYSIMAMGNATSEGNIMAVFNIKVEKAIAGDVVFELLDGSNISNAEGILLTTEDKNLNKVWTSIKGEAFAPNGIKLSEKIDAAEVAEEEKDTNLEVAVVVVATKSNGDKAVYDTDYVAYYGDTKLTEDQMNAYLQGKFGPVSKAIENMRFEYNSGVQLVAQKQVVDKTTGDVTVTDPVNMTGGSDTPKPTPTPAPASMTLKSDLGSIPVSGTAKLTATVVDLKDATPGTDVTFVIKSGADKVELMDADANGEVTKTLTVVKDKNGDATDERAASAYVRGKKTGKAVVEATYTYTGKDGKPAEVKKTVNVTVAAASTGGNGGSSDDDKTGSTGSLIAGGWNGSSNLGGLLSFSDLDSADWAKQAIAALALKGVVSGYGDGTFRPNANITRAEYCQILIGAIDKTSEYADSAYADVPSDAWFYHAVSVANANGIVSGYGDGNFGPYDLITRQDMALMTYKAAQVMNKNLSASRSMSFADAGEISEYAATAVQTLADAGIINGVSDTTFAPRDNATRAQAAKILYDTFVAVK